MKNNLSQSRKGFFSMLAVTLLCLGSNVMAVAPLDLSSTGTLVAGYVGEAALAGLAVFGAIFGIRIIVKAFKAVAK